MKLTAIVVVIAILVGFALLPGVARAGGWAVVSLDQVPTDVVAGEEFSVGFRVLHHGQTSMSHTLEGLEVYIEATHRETGRRMTFAASNTGDPGHHIAAVTLPEAGAWDWAVVSFDGPHTLYPIQVHPAGWSEKAATEAAAAPAREFWHWIAMVSSVGAGLTLLATAGVAAGVPHRKAPKTSLN